jgi:hypothetical protein
MPCSTAVAVAASAAAITIQQKIPRCSLTLVTPFTFLKNCKPTRQKSKLLSVFGQYVRFRLVKQP